MNTAISTVIEKNSEESSTSGSESDLSDSDNPPENQQGQAPQHNERPQQHQKGFLHSLITALNLPISFGKPGTKQALGQEIQELLEEGEEHGLITSLEEKMISSIMEFRDTSASEIMTPAAEVVSCEIETKMEELINIVVESGFTRIPIYKESPDKIIGIVHAKDLLRCSINPQYEHIEDILRPINSALEETPIIDLFREFQRTKVHIAIISDEFGAVRGLITLEDVLEEIVGEIDDEYDDEENEQTLEILADGGIAVHGWVDIEKIEEHFKVEFPEGPFESVGGLIAHKLGRLAQVGDNIEESGLYFEVLIASKRKIDRIRIIEGEKHNSND